MPSPLRLSPAPRRASRTGPTAGLLAGLTVVAVLSCGGSESAEAIGDSGVTASGAEAAPPDAGGPAAADSLVVVANMEVARLHLLPRDWQDLFHFRYAGLVLVLDPTTSPASAAFMEDVLRVEARRTGVADAGFDWLRRLDRAVLAYQPDADDAAFLLRRGDAAFAVLPASEAAPLLERPGFRIVPMSSGADPGRWDERAGETLPDGPEPPRDWLSTWATEVRGKG